MVRSDLLALGAVATLAAAGLARKRGAANTTGWPETVPQLLRMQAEDLAEQVAKDRRRGREGYPRRVDKALGTYLGEGETRIVYALDADFVVKVPMDPHHRGFNQNEADTWAKASRDLRALLVPVLEADPGGKWLIMPRVQTQLSMEDRSRAKRLCAAVERQVTVRYSDCDEGQNVGARADGQLFVFDYPFDPDDVPEDESRFEGPPRPALGAVAAMVLGASARRAGRAGPVGLAARRGSRATRDTFNSPAFRRWFQDSKIVDANGSPRVVYHGTNRTFDAFANDFLMDGHTANEDLDTGAGAFFASEPSEAAFFARSGPAWVERVDVQGSQIVPVYLSLQNPKIYRTREAYFLAVENAEYHDYGGGPAIATELSREGHDGIVILDSGFGSGEPSGSWYIVFDPRKIKSAVGNRGAFDPADPRIAR